MPSENNTDRLWFLGDVHGSFRYLALWNERVENSTLIQVGDLGMGFKRTGNATAEEKLAVLGVLCAQRGNKIIAIRGNPDDPAYFDNRNYNGTVYLAKDNQITEAHGKTLFLCGGAISIDRLRRVAGESYWGRTRVSAGMARCLTPPLPMWTQ